MFQNGIGSTLSLSKIIGGISKGLNIVNQAIPLYTQIKPILSNAGNLLNVFKEMNNVDNDKNNINNVVTEDILVKNKLKEETKKESPIVSNDNLPTFFQ